MCALHHITPRLFLALFLSLSYVVCLLLVCAGGVLSTTQHGHSPPPPQSLRSSPHIQEQMDCWKHRMLDVLMRSNNPLSMDSAGAASSSSSHKRKKNTGAFDDGLLVRTWVEMQAANSMDWKQTVAFNGEIPTESVIIVRTEASGSSDLMTQLSSGAHLTSLSLTHTDEFDVSQLFLRGLNYTELGSHDQTNARSIANFKEALSMAPHTLVRVCFHRLFAH